MDIYHKNKKFLIAVILVIAISALITSRNNPTIRLSPEEVFQQNLIQGTECKCILTGEKAMEYAQLAQSGRLTILSKEEPSSSACLDQNANKACTIEVRVKKVNIWEKVTIVGNAMYAG